MLSDSTQYGWVFALTAHSMGEEIMCFLTRIMGEESSCSLTAHSMSEKGVCSDSTQNGGVGHVLSDIAQYG